MMTLPPIVFAQINAVDPIHLRDVLTIVCFLLSLVTSVIALINSFRSQKREVALVDEYVRKSEYAMANEAQGERGKQVQREFDLLRAEARSERELLIKQIADMRHEIAGNIKDLHERIDDLVRAVGRVEGGN